MIAAGRRPGLRSAVGIGVLAVVAWLPALASSPGRMPADTKLYLYLDPGGLVSRAASTWEPDQFAGWVPHQQITYLWPQGPWFWLFDLLGVPDWVAHRLWIGAILFAAGAGVWWLARLLGFGRGAALSAALVYQCSPYLLAYVSRTSLLLLPWAALGWIIALTVRATRRSRLAEGHPVGEAADVAAPTGWRARLDPWVEPALIGLVVATVGSGNAAALALVAPAPVLWLVHDGRLRAGLAIATRTAVCGVVASLWWVAMLVVQARHGAAVLDFSETLRDVSSTATGPEVTRGLGYWLFYVRDLAGPTTSASLSYLQSTRGIALSFLVPLVGLAGIGLTRWRHRRYAALLVLAGAVLAVGVHPIDDPAPWADALVRDDEGGLALALRSSTRAVPVLLVGLALGTAAAVSAVAAHRRRAAATAAVGLLTLANAPALVGADLVDPNNDRDADPPEAWVDAGGRLDDPGMRVLQLPGAEFGSFRWGHTVDQPVVALADQPLVTRDLLPLGSGPAMDLLYAFDDRLQLGVAEAATIAPVARLLGADTVWLVNDLAFDRYRTARPEVVHDLVVDAPGVGDVEAFGDPEVNRADVPSIDPASVATPTIGAPLPPVVLAPVEEAVGVERVKDVVVVLAGSGDGIVDAAAAGLIDGSELVRYSGSIDGDLPDDVAAVLLTDSNRDRAHHWRGSQDVTGHTEPGGPGDDVLDPTAADQRLTVFDPPESVRAETQTVAIQDGPVTAVASSYGEPFAYTPEDRAVHAVDGDPATAWTVAEHGDPLGERLRLTLADVAGESTGLRLRQPEPGPGDRTITRVAITVAEPAGTSNTIVATLEPGSWSPAGQVVEVPVLGGGDIVTIEIVDVSAGEPATAGAVAPVGFVEVVVEGLSLGPTAEWIRTPVDLDGRLPADVPTAVVLTRERTDPSDRWRDDPERELRRIIGADAGRLDTRAVLRLDADAADALVAEAVGLDTAVADRRLDGAPDLGGWSAVDGDPSTAWFTPFDGAVGATLTVPADVAPGPVRVEAPAGDLSPVTELTLTGADGSAASVALEGDGTVRTGRLDRAVPGPVAVSITSIDARTTVDRRFGDVTVLPAAIAELDLPGVGPLPVDRSAPVERRCDDRLLTADGTPVGLSWSSTVGDLLAGTPVEATGCAPVDVAAGTRIASTGRALGFTVDRVVLATPGSAVSSNTPSAGSAAGSIEVTDRGARHRDLRVDCPQGCWFVLGEGYNDAWRLAVDGAEQPAPELVDGGFNGWWIAPTDGPVVAEARWTAQRPVSVALGASALGVTALVAVALLARRRRPAVGAETPPGASWSPARAPATLERRDAVLVVVSAAVAAGLVVGPVWAVGAAVATSVAALAGDRLADRTAWAAPDLTLAVIGATLFTVAGGAIVVRERTTAPPPDLGWPAAFDVWHRPVLLALVLIAAAAAWPHRSSR